MGLTAERLHKLGLVDEVLREPLGGAHRDPVATGAALKQALLRHLGELSAIPPDRLREQRNARIAGFGVYTEVPR